MGGDMCRWGRSQCPAGAGAWGIWVRPGEGPPSLWPESFLSGWGRQKLLAPYRSALPRGWEGVLSVGAVAGAEGRPALGCESHWRPVRAHTAQTCSAHHPLPSRTSPRRVIHLFVKHPPLPGSLPLSSPPGH